MDETKILVEYCHVIGTGRLPESVSEYTGLLLLDFLGVAAAGAVLEESSRIARDVAEAVGGVPEATAFGLTQKIPALMAAFVNGVTGHGIEMDDTHSPASSHPGVVIWPAALAMSERENRRSPALFAAAAAGYEMACRVGFAGDPPGMYDRGFHPTSTSGAFGAAVTAACLLGLTIEETMNAVGIVGSFAAGNIAYLAQGTMTKRIQPGQAAHAGILAALLAQRGYTGPKTILEGVSGFLHAYSDTAVRERLVDGLGETWEVTKTGIKAFGCCRYIHSPIESALRAVDGVSWTVENVIAIRVGAVSPGWGLVVNPIKEKYAPETRVDAQFSLPFGIATALVHGRATVYEFRESQLQDETLRDLARRVTIHQDDKLDAAYPELWPAWCEIDLRDGRTLRGEVNTTKGDPENPMVPAEIYKKFAVLGREYWDEDYLHAVADVVRSDEDILIQELMDHVRAGTAGSATMTTPHLCNQRNVAMTSPDANDIPHVDARALEWHEHDRIPGISFKVLLTKADNAFANVNMVRVPVDGIVSRHHHPNEIETVYVLSGAGVLTLGETDVPFETGHIVAIPIGVEHALQNTGDTPIELLTFFTPPIE